MGVIQKYDNHPTDQLLILDSTDDEADDQYSDHYDDHDDVTDLRSPRSLHVQNEALQAQVHSMKEEVSGLRKMLLDGIMDLNTLKHELKKAQCQCQCECSKQKQKPQIPAKPTLKK